MTRLERALAALTLLLTTDAIFPLIGLDPSTAGVVEQTNDSGSLLKQVVFMSLYVLWGAVLLRRVGLVTVLRQVPLVWVVVGFVGASVLWSVDPTLSARRWVAFAGTATFGVYLGACWSRLQLVRLFVATGVIAIVASFLATLVIPDLAMLYDGRGVAWNGIFGHKNELGRFMAWTLFTAWLLRRASSSPRERLLALLVAVGAAALIVLSESKTALVVAVVMLGMVPAQRAAQTLRRQGPLLLTGVGAITGAVAVVAATLAADNWAALTGLLGRDATLTGRTYIWKAVLESIAERPWIGYGYSAFWGGIGSPATAVWAKTGRLLDGLHVSHAHNGLLDLVLQVGIVGAAAYLVLVGATLVWSLRSLRTSGATSEALLPLGFLVFLLIYNSIESRTIQQNSFLWVGVCAIATMRGLTRSAAAPARVLSPRVGSAPRPRPREMRSGTSSTS